MTSYAEQKGFDKMDWLKIFKLLARKYSLHEEVAKDIAMNSVTGYCSDLTHGPSGALSSRLNRAEGGALENSVLSLMLSELLELAELKEWKLCHDKYQEMIQYSPMAIDDEDDDRDQQNFENELTSSQH